MFRFEGEKMEYLYGAMLLHRAGKQITEEALDKVLTAAGVTTDKTKVKATVAALHSVDIDKVIKEASVMTAAPAAASAGPAAKKEEKKPEEAKATEEEAAAGLGALFG